MDLNLTSQIELEHLFSKYQLHACIKQEFVESGFVDKLEDNEIEILFGLDLLTQLVLHKRANIPTLVGMLQKHFEGYSKPAQVCAEMILKAAEKDFIDWDDLTQNAIMKWDISDDVKDQLDLFQYPLPMIEEPQHVTHNRQTGYVTVKGSIILRDNHHEDDVCLDHINRANSIPLSLNEDIVAFIQNEWKNLDKCKPGEAKEDYKKRVKAFEKYDRTSRDVLAALMAQGNRFWLTHKYDKRGRTYCQGYHATYQGNDWNKACIQFADAEVLNDE